MNPIFQGKMIYLKSNRYASLIFPFVQIKKAYQLLFTFLFKLMWNELINDQKVENDMATSLLFFLFCLLALFSYYLDRYVSVIIIIFMILWYFDYSLARRNYLKSNNEIDIILTQSQEGEVTWETTLPDRKVLKSKFLPIQVEQIRISQKSVYGGAFQTLLEKIWQAELSFTEGSDLVIYEDRQVIDVLKKAQDLVKILNVPVIFPSSQGYGNYVEEVVDREVDGSFNKIKGQLVYCKIGSRKFHIASQWNFNNSWLLIQKIIQESGFLLFVIIVTNKMSKIGEALHRFFIKKEIFIDHSLLFIHPYIFNSFNGLILLLAIVVMVFKGWQLSRVKHIYIDRYYLRFLIDNQKIKQINSQEIKSVFLIKSPYLALMILGQNEVVIIDKFQRLEDGLAFLYTLELGVKRFQLGDSNQNLL